MGAKGDNCPGLAPMQNRAMQRKLDKGECLDVSACARIANGDYVLRIFLEGVDYCNAQTEEWIWSIGKLLEPLHTAMADGSHRTLPVDTFLASGSTRYYSAGESLTIECVFLR